MPLDISTITLAGAIVSLAGALIVLLYWAHERTAWAALWWAAASCGKGIGVGLLAFHAVLPPQVSQGAAPLILNLSALLAWIAARIFSRGSVRGWPILLGYGAWVVVVAVTGANAREQVVGALGCTSAGGLYLAAAIVLWRGRSERLRARAPMMAVLALYAAALFMLALQNLEAVVFQSIPRLDWLGMVPFVDLIYSVGVTSCLIMMLKERGEAALKSAALTDSLTGLANRRAFMDHAQRLLERHRRDNEPIHLLAFDLDHFKKVNDTFGHAAGDQVLRVFADTISRILRSTDVAARLGGEEFVATVANCSVETALATAERIRRAFQDNARFLNGAPIGATVSVGVAAGDGFEGSIGALLADADNALYRAKDLGRNCVVLAGDNPPEAPASNVIPIALSRRAR